MSPKKGAPQGQTAPRIRPGRSRRAKVLYIVCEGLTECTYFGALADEFRDRHDFKLHITPTPPKPGKTKKFNGYKPRSAVQEAARQRRAQRGVTSAQFWAVFDKDDNPDAALLAAYDLARKEGVSVAFSHACFELWLLLHFASGPPGGFGGEQKAITRRLKQVKGWEGFEKHVTAQLFGTLLGKEGHATKIASRLVAGCPSERCGPAEHAADCSKRLMCDPSTDVHRILLALGVISLPSASTSPRSDNPCNA
ncbi:RloB family protein [Actinomadura flavalba]|uniref:RloB family protein n=1 Tax=Actinomadura flavalba TaxID=1120938 RepID=UPI000380E55E|nr:RloB family protein [Actinomadura flavalba]